MKKRNTNSGFTIVELLIVIIVIAILAAIILVTYSSATQKATITSLTSDLSNFSTELSSYMAHYGFFPTALDGNKCPTAPVSDANFCLKPSNGSTLTYNSNASIYPSNYHLTETNGNNSYSVTNTTSPTIATTPYGSTIGSACPSGFIPVPGSGTYGTNDFCVMKYAASQVGSTNVPISQAGSLPWVNITQTTAAADAPNVVGCTGCHLITDAEFLTIAQNVLKVASNWSGGAVGSGYIYSGHNDDDPDAVLASDPSGQDTNGYYGETNKNGNQRRTLTLTNGQVIWDLAGNVYEWTSGQTLGTSAEQPGVIGNGWAWREWNSITNIGSLTPNSSPVATGISGAASWNSSNGIGQIWSNADSTGWYGFLRGGYINSWGYGGVLALNLNTGPIYTTVYIGFRVAR